MPIGGGTREVYAQSTMTKAELHVLVDELPDDAVEATAKLLRRIRLHEFDPDQAWVWSAWWQEQLRESAADIALGRTRQFNSGAQLLESLTQRSGEDRV